MYFHSWDHRKYPTGRINWSNKQHYTTNQSWGKCGKMGGIFKFAPFFILLIQQDHGHGLVTFVDHLRQWRVRPRAPRRWSRPPDRLGRRVPHTWRHLVATGTGVFQVGHLVHGHVFRSVMNERHVRTTSHDDETLGYTNEGGQQDEECDQLRHFTVCVDTLVFMM